MVRINRWHLAGIAMMVLIMFVVGISITSCGKSSGSSSGSSTPAVGARGIAVDPYVVGARFFEDLNNDGIKDLAEQVSSLSDSNGVFTFANALTTTSTIVLDHTVIPMHIGITYTCTLKRKVDSITETLVASPLTTLLANGWTADDIINALSNAGLTGLTASDLTANPMEGIENLDSTALTDTHLTKIKACICVYSFMAVMDTLIAGKGYDITPISFTGTAGATQALANMVITVNTALSTGLLSTIQTMMSGAPPATPKVTAGDVIRSAVAISNYIIPKVAAAPTTYVPDLAEINALGQSLGVNFYNIRNRDYVFVQYALAQIPSMIPGALPGITTFNTLIVNSLGVVEGQFNYGGGGDSSGSLDGLNKLDGFYRPFSATGTVFVLKDNPISPDLKITSSEEIHIFIEAITNTVSFHIEPISTTTKKQAVINIWGLSSYYPNPDKNKPLTLYRHADGLFQKEFSINNNDKHTYTQDISKRHHIYILPGKTTVYLSGSPGEVISLAERFGAVINEDIVVQSDGFIIDGSNTVINGPGWGYGIYLNSRIGVTIRNCTVQNFNYGIFLTDSSNNTIITNTANSNGIGIYLYYSSTNTLISNTANANNSYGIFSIEGEKNKIIHNTANSNGYAGIYITGSKNILTNNTANSNSDSGIAVAGSFNNIDANITMSNREGIKVGGAVSNNTIINNTVTANCFGIHLAYTWDNKIYHNNVYDNDRPPDPIWPVGPYNVYAYSDTPIEYELSYNNEGNWWGRTSAPGFIAGVDSNAFNVVDTYWYLVKDGWLKGYAPWQPEKPPDTTPPTGTILINADNPYTNNVLVNLTLSAQDPESSVTEMRFSNDAYNWFLWEPYTPAKQWTLTTGDGLKTVYVEYKNGAGLTAIFSDTIILQTLPPPIIPNAPSNLVATAVSSSQINLIWQDNSDSEQGFKIELKLGLNGTFTELATVPTNITSYSDTNLYPSANYYYRVRAYNEIGDSDYSNTDGARTFAPTPPSAEAINLMLHQYYQNGQIKNYGIYNSLSVKLNAAQNSIDAHNYHVAVNQLNAFSNEVNAQIGKGISSEAGESLLIPTYYLINYISTIKTGSGQHLVLLIFKPINWDSISISVLETPTPYEPEAPNSSAIHVTETTEGRLTFAYTDLSGQCVEIHRLIHINNYTRGISYNGLPVTTLGDIFSPLPSPVGSDSITLVMDFSYWLTVCTVTIDPTSGVMSHKFCKTVYRTDSRDIDSLIPTAPDKDPTKPDKTKKEDEDYQKGVDPENKSERTGPPTDSYNCHGWTFACDKTNIDNGQVETILKKNGYKKCDPPREGGVIVYRKTKNGPPTHSGIITKVKDGKVTQVESKHGSYGRYKHPPDVPKDDPKTPGDENYGAFQECWCTDRPGTGKDQHTLNTIHWDPAKCGCLGLEGLLPLFIIWFIRRIKRNLKIV